MQTKKVIILCDGNVYAKKAIDITYDANAAFDMAEFLAYILNSFDENEMEALERFVYDSKGRPALPYLTRIDV